MHVCMVACESIWVCTCTCICVNSHILKMVSFKLTKSWKRNYFGERNLKIPWKQILLLGNLEIFSLQAANLIDKTIIQVIRWRPVIWIFPKKNYLLQQFLAGEKKTSFVERKFFIRILMQQKALISLRKDCIGFCETKMSCTYTAYRL